MNIKDYLIEYNESQGWATTDADLMETLTESRIVYRENQGSRRWWDDWFYVAKIGDKYIGYDWAKANRDESIFDLGWEFDWNSVCEVEPQEKNGCCVCEEINL